MQPSFYLTSYPCPDDPDRVLVFSTRKASSVLLDKKTCDDLQRGTLTPGPAATLERLQMLVPDQEAEKRALLGLIDRQNPRNKGLHIVVVLNLDCNFACPYCFEEGVKGDLYMRSATAELLPAFIESQWQDHKDTLRIDFYGGEPLLSLDLIESIARSARSFATRKNASFYFTLVSNGSLFTRQTAERLVPLGLRNIKVTLDGPAEVHNRTRPFTSGAGSFAAIVRNIRDTCELVKFTIGGNFTRATYEKFPLLLDHLEAEGLTPDRIPLMKFDPVLDLPQNRSHKEYLSGCCSINEPWLLAAEALLRGEILKRGYHTPKPSPLTCMVETKDAHVVNYDGTLYKCPAFIGKEGFATGSLKEGLVDYAAAYRLGIYKNPDCAACVYLPLCFGGCRYMAYAREGSIDTLDCKKDYLDASLETLLNQDIKYRRRKQA